jgi:hypothetical protein
LKGIALYQQSIIDFTPKKSTISSYNIHNTMENDIDLDAFDSALLNCWDDAEKSDGKDTSPRNSSQERSPSDNGVGWMTSGSRLPSFLMDDEIPYSKSAEEAQSQQQQQQLQQQQQQQQESWNNHEHHMKQGNTNDHTSSLGNSSALSSSKNPVPVSTNASLSSRDNAGNRFMDSDRSGLSIMNSHTSISESEKQPSVQMGPSSQHVSTEQSNATLHQHHQNHATDVSQDSSTPHTWQLHPLGIQSSANCANLSHVAQAPAPASHAVPANMLPLACNALAAGVDMTSFFQQQMDANLLAAMATAQQQQHHHHHPHHNNMGIPSSIGGPSSERALHLTANATRDNNQAEYASRSDIPDARGRKSNRSNRNNSTPDLPPFRLFDAPVELRHNFAQAQRALGIPVLNDANSIHFDMSSSETGESDANKKMSEVKFVDARHGDLGMKRMKNAKEQRRAQRITELIEQLRMKMEKSGWQSGMKSKLNTLSS